VNQSIKAVIINYY